MTHLIEMCCNFLLEMNKGKVTTKSVFESQQYLALIEVIKLLSSLAGWMKMLKELHVVHSK